MSLFYLMSADTMTIGEATHKAIDIVWIDRITAFLGGELDSLAHDLADVIAVEIQPVLARPSVQLRAKICGIVEIARVWSTWLV